MSAVQIIVAILATAIVVPIGMAAMFAIALRERWTVFDRFLMLGRRPHRRARHGAQPHSGVAIKPTIRVLAKNRRARVRDNSAARRFGRTPDNGLDDILHGSFAVDSYNRAVRWLTWSFILAVLAIVSISQLWTPVEPQIFATLIVAGVFVLVIQELMPFESLRTARVIIEGSAAILFLTMLVALTGHSDSPFFFLYLILVGGAALIAAPAVTIVLTIETVLAYVVTALSGPMDGGNYRDSMVRIGINLTALVLLAYSGIVVARVQRRTREAAIRLSTVDSLTGLFNRGFLFNAVNREIKRAKRFRRGFCLLMIDLDGLKSINDRHGHFVGDNVLRTVAQVILANVRSIDTAARYGGDEFVALLPETDPHGAYVLAEKIRQVACELAMQAHGEPITTSVSIGVVSYPGDGQTADELVVAADEAMYESKRMGKNMVIGYSSSSENVQPTPIR
jgi:diguanylate cyclase (GGDEF)-like protein